MKKRYAFLMLICILSMSSCGTIALNSNSLIEPAQLNSAGQPTYTVIESFKVNDKAGWVLGIIPANKPAGDRHEYFAEFLQRQISEAGGDAVINVEVRMQNNFGDFLISVVTAGLYVTRTVTVSGDIIKYN
ncbi:MAG: DUF6567 family protein [candidate division Zixibacteria bacterium]